MPEKKSLAELQEELWGGAPLFGEPILGASLLPPGEETRRKRRFISAPVSPAEEKAFFQNLLRDQRVQQLQKAFLIHAGKNPDEAARLMNLAEISGFPVWMLDHEGDAKKRAEQIDALRRAQIRDWMLFLQENPATANFLSDEDMMAIAHDDVTSLTRQESIFRRLWDLVAEFPRGARVGRLQIERARLGEKLKAARERTPERIPEEEHREFVSRFLAARTGAAADMRQLESAIRRGEDPRQYTKNLYVRMHLEYPGLTDEEIIERLRYSEIWTPGDQARLEQIERILAEEEKAPEGGWLAYAIRQAGQIWPFMWEGIVTTAMTGGMGAGPAIEAARQAIGAARTAGAIGRAGAAAAKAGLRAIEALPVFETARETEAGGAYLDLVQMLEENGVTGKEAEETARKASDVVGYINAALEVVEFESFAGLLGGLGRQAGKRAAERLLKNLLLRPTVRRAIMKTALGIARNVGTEAMTEVLQELTNVAAEEIVRQAAGIGVGAPTKREIAVRLFETFKAVAAGSGVYAAIGLPATLGRSIRIARAAQTQTALIQELNNAAAESKTRKRMPAAMRKFVELATQDGPIEAAYIDAQALRQVLEQQGIDPAALMQELGLSAEDYQAALAAGPGGKLAVPIGVYQEKLAGTHLGLTLQNDTTLNPEIPTAREAAAFEEQVKQKEQEILRQAQEIVARDTTLAREHDYILESLRAQYVSAGRSIQEATYAAEIQAAFFTTIGQAAGRSPKELFESLRLQVEQRGTKGVQPSAPPMPSEAEAKTIIINAKPIGERTFEEAGRQGVRSYQSIYPALAPHIQAEARRLLSDLSAATKGEKFWRTDEAGMRVTGVKRRVSPPLARILDELGASYAETAKALEDIARGGGAENYALAKKIELILDDILTSGTTDIEGAEVLPNEEYLAAKRELQMEQAAIYEQIAYHASLALFPRFSTVYVGTGLGGEGFGWGIYFTSRRELAEHYLRLLEELRGRQGYLYEVHIPEDSEFLDWDAPLSRQPLEVQRRLEEMRVRAGLPEKLFDGDPIGKEFYRALGEHLESDQKASLLLRDYGIPGHLRHTRLMGGATNYIIYDEAATEIMRYYQEAITKTDTEAFKKWFGDSKVVDEEGRPLVVYHGTPTAGFEIFDMSRRGARTGHRPEDVGFHFTDSPTIAETYSGAYKIEAYNRFTELIGRPPAIPIPRAPAIYPVYLRITNPLILDTAREINAETIQQAKENGHDGIIASLGGGTREYVVFSPEQIKSAIANIGTFDLTKPSILEQPGISPLGFYSAQETIAGPPSVENAITNPHEFIVSRLKFIDKRWTLNIEAALGPGKYFGFNPEDLIHEYAVEEGDEELVELSPEEYRITQAILRPKNPLIITTQEEFDAMQREAFGEDSVYVKAPYLITTRRSNPEIAEWAKKQGYDAIIIKIKDLAFNLQRYLGVDQVLVLDDSIIAEGEVFEQIPISPLGFYSAVERAIAEMDFKSIPAQDLLARIRKTPGIKQDELEWLGLPEWLEAAAQDGRKVTKEEILEFIRAGGVQLEEVVKGYNPQAEAAIQALIEERAKNNFEEFWYGGGREKYLEDAIEEKIRRKWDVLPKEKKEKDYDNDIGLFRKYYQRNWEDLFIEDELIKYKEGAWEYFNIELIENARRELTYEIEEMIEETKYEEYILPGGENYQEVLLILPVKKSIPSYEEWVQLKKNNQPPDILGLGLESDDPYATDFSRERYEIEKYEMRESPSYRSSHWDEENVLAHFRLTDRTDEWGRRVLFIEEIQSDWHQKGRKEGYRSKEWAVIDVRNGRVIKEFDSEIEAKDWIESDQHVIRPIYADVKRQGGIPNAPFKATESWAMLCFKRILRMAVEQGYDAVAWTPGEMQAERYNLSKLVNELRYFPESSRLVAFDTVGREALTQTVKPEELPAFVGKEIAEKLLAAPVEDGAHVLRGLNLRLGGEGMKGFYDRILPSAVGKYIKKLDKEAKVETILVDAGEEGQVEVWSVDMTPAIREAVMAGQPYFQTGEEVAGPRGEIQIDPTGIRIAFGPGADASTVMHEGAHVWLLLLQRLGEQEGATPEIRELWEQTRAWAYGQEAFSLAWDHGGLSDAAKARFLTTYGTREQVFAAFSGGVQDPELRRIAHEGFAKAFELYLERGEAPTPGLRAAFEQFRQWLIAIYRRLTGQEVEISEEVRNLFDRMIAGDQALAATRAEHETSAMTDRLLNLDPEQATEAARLLEEAEAEAEARLLKASVGDLLARAEERKRAEAEITPEVEQEIRSLPVYQLLEDIRSGDLLPFKTSAIAAYIQADEDWVRLPANFHAEDGPMDPEIVAESYGFSSADEMIQAVLDAPPLDEAIMAEVKRRLDALYPPIDAAQVEEDALAAIHNEKYLELLAMEEQILAGRARTEERRAAAQARLAAVRAWAKKTMAQKRWMDARRVSDFIAAERRAAREAIAALERGDREAAAQAKYAHMLQAALVRESLRIERESREIEKRFHRIISRTAKNMLGLQGEDLLQLDALLGRFGFGRGLPEGIEKQALPEYLDALSGEGYTVTISPAMANESYRKRQDQLTVADVLDLNDAVMNIMRIGRMRRRLLTQREQADVDAAAAELAGAARTAIESKKLQYKAWQSLGEKVKSNLLSFHYHHMKIEHLCRLLDGGRDDGPWQRYIYRIMADANGVESTLRAKAREDLAEIIRRHYGKDAIGDWAHRKYYIPELGQSLTKENLVCLALNWGNEGNRDRVMYGQGWTEEQVMAALDRLEKNDWDFVQAVWDYLDRTYWPLCLQVVERTGGVIREKVQPVPVQTRFGTYRGGYYPIKHDPTWSEEAMRNVERESAELFLRQQHLSMQTPQGHLKERAVHLEGRPVKLSLDVLTTHITNVIHDVAFRPAIRDALKLIRHKAVEAAVKETLGTEAYREFEPWLSNIASEYREPFDAVSRALSRIRRNASIVNMGWKATVALSQLAGVFPMATRIGAGRVASGMIRFYVNPLAWREKTEFVRERSAMMADRARSMDRDVRDAIKNLVSRNAWTAVQETMFGWIALMDQAITIPGWLAAYELELERSQDEGKAVEFADAVIRQTQGTGYASDLAAVQRGSEYKKLFTMYYSYFNTVYNLMAESGQRTKRLRDVPQLAATVLFVWLFPAVVSELLSGRGPGEEPEDERAAWWLKTIFAYPFSAIVGIRDIARGLMYREYQMSPVVDAYQSIGDFIRRTGRAVTEPESETIRAAGESTLEMLGYVLGLPSRQIIITAGSLIDWLTGEGEIYLRDLLFTRPRERRR